MSYGPTLVRGFVFIVVLFGNLGYFFFFFGPAESLFPIQSFWPLLPKLSCLEAGGGKQGFNVISQKTFTYKKFHVNIAAEDFSQLLLGSSGPNR